MLMTGKEMLKVAQERKFAIPAFNSGSGQLFTATMEVMEELQAPVLMAIHPDELSFLKDSFIGQVMHAANHTKLPVCIHLDHGATYEQAIHAINLGFTSVMIDASLKPFEENIAITKKVVEAAHATGVSVEAELGTIGTLGDNVEGGVANITYTDPIKAVEFVERTGVDSLAIAIGTAHGLYPKDVKPELRLDILDEIVKNVSIPLVLHGGSGNPDDEISQAIEKGLAKINISSDIKIVFADKLREILNSNISGIREPNVLFPPCMEETKKVVAQKTILFKANNTAQYYYS